MSHLALGVFSAFDPLCHCTKQVSDFSYSVVGNNTTDNFEEQITIHEGKELIWSKGSQIIRKFSYETNSHDIETIKQGFFCQFGSQSSKFLCIVHSHSLRLYNVTGGQEFLVPLPCKVTKCWAFAFSNVRGIFIERMVQSGEKSADPILFSLLHPLDEIKPVAREHAADPCQSEYVTSTDSIAYVGSQEPILVLKNGVSQRYDVHYVEKVIHEATNDSVTLEAEVILKRATSIPAELSSLSSSNDAQIVMYDSFDSRNGLIGLLGFNVSEKLYVFRISLNDKKLSIDYAGALSNILSVAVISLPCLALRETVSLSRMLIALESNGTLTIHMGDQCLVRYPQISSQLLRQVENVRAVKVADAHADRFSLLMSNGKLYRTSIHSSFKHSSLVEDCLSILRRVLPFPVFMAVFKDFQEECKLRRTENVWSAFHDLLQHLLQVSTTSQTQDLWERMLQEEAGSSSSLLLKEFHTDAAILRKSISHIAFAFHLLFEDYQLQVLRHAERELLAQFLYPLCKHIGWINFVEYYLKNFPQLATVSVIPLGAKVPMETNNVVYADDWKKQEQPPSILKWIYERLLNVQSSLFPLVYKSRTTQLTRKICRICFELTNSSNANPYNVSKNAGFDDSSKPYESVIKSLAEENMTKASLSSLPFGIAQIIQELINQSKSNPPSSWDAATYRLIGRDDLAMSFHPGDRIGAISDARSNAPYFYEYVEKEEAHEEEKLKRKSKPAPQLLSKPKGLGHILFTEDKRLQEVYNMLNSAAPIKLNKDQEEVQTGGEKQDASISMLAHRALSLPFGRAMLTLRNRKMTQPYAESMSIPAIAMTCQLKRNKKATVTIEIQYPSADPVDLNAAKKDFPWPEFHNGVAAGLSMESAATTKSPISREWIAYHRPKQKASNTHAGMLLGLGLNGHLSSLASTDIFSYLSLRHDLTSIAVLLGISLSKRGTQDNFVNKTLSLHVPLLVVGADLEVPVEVQTATLLGLGIVYQESCHRFTTEILLDELARPPDDNTVSALREGYSLAAGLGLGLVCLAKGNNPSIKGLSDLNLEEKLIRYMEPGIRPASDPFLLRKLEVEGSQKLPSQKSTKIQESDKFVNIDVTGPGACLALALIYLQTNNHAVASKMTLPDTKYSLEFVRPHMAMLRIVAGSLIMWDEIEATPAWVNKHVPKTLLTSRPPASEEDPERDPMKVLLAHVIAGACLALGLKFAGSANKKAYTTILQYLHLFINIGLESNSKLSKVQEQLSSLDKQIAMQCALICLMSASCVVAGKGHVELVKIILKLRKMNEGNYGGQVAVSMSLGLVFLGSGKCSLSTSPQSIAYLLCALYPMFPQSYTDNRYHLQAFRHLFVLAAEERLLQVRDVETSETCFVPVTIHQYIPSPSSTKPLVYERKTPCLIPELSQITKLEINSPRYYALSLDLSTLEQKRAFANGGLVLYVKKKTGYLSYAEDPLGVRNSEYILPLLKSYPASSAESSERHQKHAMTTFFGQSTNEKHIHSFAAVFSDCPSLVQRALALDDTSMVYVYQYIENALSKAATDPSSLWNLKLLVAFYEHFAPQAASNALLESNYLQDIQSKLESNFHEKNISILLAKKLSGASLPIEQELVLSNYLDLVDIPLHKLSLALSSIPKEVFAAKDTQLLAVSLACALPSSTPFSVLENIAASLAK